MTPQVIQKSLVDLKWPCEIKFKFLTIFFTFQSWITVNRSDYHPPIYAGIKMSTLYLYLNIHNLNEN